MKTEIQIDFREWMDWSREGGVLLMLSELLAPHGVGLRDERPVGADFLELVAESENGEALEEPHSGPGFAAKYVPAATIDEADADLAECLRLALVMAGAALEIRPDHANQIEGKMQLEEMLLHLEMAVLALKRLKGGAQ